MYAAAFELTSWMGTQQYFFEGKDACALLAQFESVQSLDCLVYMGRGQEDAKGQKELDKLEEILKKYRAGRLTTDDLLTLNVSLSLGTIRCLDVEKGKNAIDVLRARYPKEG